MFTWRRRLGQNSGCNCGHKKIMVPSGSKSFEILLCCGIQIYNKKLLVNLFIASLRVICLSLNFKNCMVVLAFLIVQLENALWFSGQKLYVNWRGGRL